MSDKAGQEAMLYFIEVLMNSNGPLTVGQLAGRFGSRSFTPEMRMAAGGDEAGLRRFLAKYPSLFALDGSAVSINNHGVIIPSVAVEPLTPAEAVLPPIPDATAELRAVQFFQDKLSRKGGVLPVKSLAGHLSQAPAELRQCVGPQNSFIKFLLKHPDIFCINNETTCVYLPRLDRIEAAKKADDLHVNGNSGSDEDKVKDLLPKESKGSKPSPITMTASEYKTMKFVKDVVERSEGRAMLSIVMAEIGTSGPDAVKNIIGESQAKLEEFVKKYPNIFCIDGEDNVVMKKTRLNVIMAGSRPSLLLQQQQQQYEKPTSDPEKTPLDKLPAVGTLAAAAIVPAAPVRRTYNNHRGPVYHLAKLWGIIDLGKHEHVFFDRSILPDGYDDLGKQFKVGETLRFNAVRAARGSRARWRATHVWRDGQDIRSMYGADATFTSSAGAVNQSAIDDEVKRVLPTSCCCCCGGGAQSSGAASGDDLSLSAYEPYAYSDATPSTAGVVPVWTVRGGDAAAGGGAIPSLSMVPEMRFMHKSSQLDANFVPSYLLGTGSSLSAANSCSESCAGTREIACQTVSTGDIMATQFYEDE